MSSKDILEIVSEFTREESFVCYLKLKGLKHKEIAAMMGVRYSIDNDPIQDYSSAVYKKSEVEGKKLGLLRKNIGALMDVVGPNLEGKDDLEWKDKVKWKDWVWPTKRLSELILEQTFLKMIQASPQVTPQETPQNPAKEKESEPLTNNETRQESPQTKPSEKAFEPSLKQDTTEGNPQEATNEKPSEQFQKRLQNIFESFNETVKTTAQSSRAQLIAFGGLIVLIIILVIVNRGGSQKAALAPEITPSLILTQIIQNTPENTATLLQPSSTITQAVVEPPTETPIPTQTKEPTNTPTQTKTPTETFTPTLTPVVLFSDDFSGDLSKWKVYGFPPYYPNNKVVIANDALTTSDYYGTWVVADIPAAPTNYQIIINFKSILCGGDGDFFSPAFNGNIHMIAFWANGCALAWNYTKGDTSVFNFPGTEGGNGSGDQHLVITVKGKKFIAKLNNGDDLSVVNDLGYPEGKIAIFIETGDLIYDVTVIDLPK